LSEVLDSLEQRHRLADGVPLIAQLSGVLTLPPRRLGRSELPLGGYADVATRGQPEQLLPGQFALDTVEFLRRFAQRELLYYQREEPRSRTSEQIVVVLDQGVRTWGVVRLILGAACLAMGRQAARRGVPLRIATTGDPWRLVDPLEADQESLGRMVEASDLSPHPAEVLSAALQQPADSHRDIVVLTQARSLAEPEVVRAARQVPSGTRLFAVAVDRRGVLELVELRRGSPVNLARCRVEIRPVLERSTPPSAPPSPATWTGDVEPIGYPFRIGLMGQVSPRLFDFDESGEWLFVGSANATIHAWRIDGTREEILPRGLCRDEPLTTLDTLVGVAGGFLVIGANRLGQAAVHYDIVARRARSVFLGTPTTRSWEMIYLAPLNSVVAREQRDGTTQVAFDLADLGAPLGLGLDSPRVCPRAQLAWKAVARMEPFQGVIAAGTLSSFSGHSGSRPGSSTRTISWTNTWTVGLFSRPSIASETSPAPEPQTLDASQCLRQVQAVLHSDSGSLRVVTDRGEWPPFVPLSDGKPVLKGHRLLWAEAAGDLVAASFAPNRGTGRSSHPARLRIYSGPMGRAVGEFAVPGHSREFCLSRDGRLLARRISSRQIEVREVVGKPVPLLVTRRGKFHTQLHIELGEDCLISRTGDHQHRFTWGDGNLRSFYQRLSGSVRPARVDRPEIGWSRSPTASPVSVRTSPLPSPLKDCTRFKAWCRGRLLLAVDNWGQIALFHQDGSLICLLLVFRDRFAIWMPDGTQCGDPRLLLGEPTHDAFQRIGNRLRMASGHGRDVSK
jgi:hypothetical protein